MLHELEKLAKSTEYLKIFFALLFIGIITLPFLRELWSKEQREMIKGMKGDNQRWDWSEIWELIISQESVFVPVLLQQIAAVESK